MSKRYIKLTPNLEERAKNNSHAPIVLQPTELKTLDDVLPVIIAEPIVSAAEDESKLKPKRKRKPLTDEQKARRRERMRKFRESMTDEEREEYLKRNREYYRRRYANKTEEQRLAESEIRRRKYLENKEKIRADYHERISKMSADELAEYRRKHTEYARAFREAQVEKQGYYISDHGKKRVLRDKYRIKLREDINKRISKTSLFKRLIGQINENLENYAV